MLLILRQKNSMKKIPLVYKIRLVRQQNQSNFASEQTEKAKELASKGSSKAKELTESRVK